MHIRIGLKNNPRELSFEVDGERDALVDQLRGSLGEGAGIVELVDAKGHTHFVTASEVAYVEVDSAARPAVGFGGA